MLHGVPLAAALVGSLTVAAGDLPQTNETFRQALSARDAPLSAARLDVLLVKREKSYEFVRNPRPGVQVYLTVPTGESQDHASRLSVFYLGEDVRLERTALARKEKRRLKAVDPGIVARRTRSRWSTEPQGASVVEEVTLEGVEDARSVRRARRDSARSMLLQVARDVSLGLGTGLGRRLKRIDRLEQTGTGYRIDGVAEILPGVERSVVAELDADLIVRTCTWTVETDRQQTVCEYASEGRRETAAGMTIAESGTFIQKSRLRDSAGEEVDGSQWGEWDVLVAEAYSSVGLESVDVLDELEDREAAGSDALPDLDGSVVPFSKRGGGLSFHIVWISLVIACLPLAMALRSGRESREKRRDAGDARWAKRRLAFAATPLLVFAVGTFSLHLSPAAVAAPQAFDPEPFGPCGDCVSGLIGTRILFGKLECEHGPEHDPDCDMTGGMPSCEEFRQNPRPPGNDHTSDGICHCFLCGVAAGCERAPEKQQAICKPRPNGGTCPAILQRYSTLVEVETSLPTRPVDGSAGCAAGPPTPGEQDKTTCGGSRHIAGCLTNNCEIDPNGTIISRYTYERIECP